MAYYIRCEMCGAYLDPGERCDCDAQCESAEKEKSRSAGTETANQKKFGKTLCNKYNVLKQKCQEKGLVKNYERIS